jgi:hypothetical protein
VSVVVPVMTVWAEAWSPENAVTIAAAATKARAAVRQDRRSHDGAVDAEKRTEIMVFPPGEGVVGNGVRDVPESQ